LTSERVDE